MLTTIRHLVFGTMPVLAFAQTEVQDGKPCGIVLVEVKPGKEWVTAWYREGDAEWAHGHYWTTEDQARAEFMNRIRKEWWR